MSSKRTIYQTRVSQILDHTPQIRELIIDFVEPSEFHFKAGQFVMLHVPQAEKPALRAYSIASDDRVKNRFHLLFKYVTNGVASTYVWNLKGGETLEFTGPFGRIFFQEPPAQQIVFMCTGSGLAQHICYLLSKQDEYPDIDYTLFLGLRDEQDIYYTSVLDNLKTKLKKFNYHIVLSKPANLWQGKIGYIQEYLKDIDYKNIETSFYLCGNKAMIQESKKILIEENNFDQTKIYSEAFD